MLVDTFDVLDNSGLASQGVLARAINEVLLGDSVPSMSDVASKAQIADQIRFALVGDKYGDDVLCDLNDLMLSLTRPFGACHELLPVGCELCTAWVNRKLQTQNNGSVLVRKPGRFISDDPETVAIYRLSPQVERATNTLFRTGQMFTDSVTRMPALAQYTSPLIGRVHGVANAQLPVPTNGNGNGRQVGNGGGK